MSGASPTPFLYTRPSHRTACTPHSGERHHPALPLAVVSSDQALIHRHECPVGLRASHTPPTAKQHPEPSPGTPDWQTPPSLPRPTFPGPPDRDPTAAVNPSRVKRTAYRSAPGFLLKSPCPFRFLTRGPNQCKSNYIQALFYSLRPLNFLSFEPVVRPA